MKKSALEKLGDAIKTALREEATSDVLSMLTGAFVSLTVEVVRREGYDVNRDIKVDGRENRDVTIHAPKGLK